MRHFCKCKSRLSALSQTQYPVHTERAFRRWIGRWIVTCRVQIIITRLLIIIVRIKKKKMISNVKTERRTRQEDGTPGSCRDPASCNYLNSQLNGDLLPSPFLFLLVRGSNRKKSRKQADSRLPPFRRADTSS